MDMSMHPQNQQINSVLPIGQQIDSVVWSVSGCGLPFPSMPKKLLNKLRKLHEAVKIALDVYFAWQFFRFSWLSGYQIIKWLSKGQGEIKFIHRMMIFHMILQKIFNDIPDDFLVDDYDVNYNNDYNDGDDSRNDDNGNNVNDTNDNYFHR